MIRWKFRGFCGVTGAHSRAAASAAFAILVGGVVVPGCGGGASQARPIINVATSPGAASAFAPIRDAWSADPKQRIALEPKLVDFISRFPADGLTPLVRVYLAFARIDEGDLPEASAQLAHLGVLPLGATSDLAEVAHARLLRLRGYGDQAFEALRPLVGKMVDPVSRALLNEEVSLAAVDAKRDYEAIADMDTWLRNASDEDHEAVKEKVTAALAKESQAVLVNALRAMRAGGAASGYGREIQRLVSERLGALALAKNDSDLARWLVEGDLGAPLLGQEEGALGELATTKRGLANIDGRTIGLVLPTGSADLRDEAAAITLGVAAALDLPRSDASQGDHTKLITRDDGGDANRVEPSMDELAGEGAVVILAALDPTSADRAVRWGEAHSVGVIVLAEPRASASSDSDGGAPPARATPKAWTFVAGVPRGDEIAVLGEELVSRGLKKIVPIVPPSGSEAVRALSLGTVTLEPEIACDTAAAQSGEAHFPVADWKKERARAWLVDAPSECARDLLLELAAAGVDGTMGLTLDAANTSARAPGVHELAVRAGEIPVTAATPAVTADPEVRAWFTREGSPPNFWAALGHDAAVLARGAVSALPLDATTDPVEVTRRRTTAKEALVAAQAHLWTSEARGFGSDHVLPRTLKAIDLAAATGK
jgi:hypothetical protein